MFVSNGPLIEANINNQTYGQTTSSAGSEVTVNVKISAAPWVPVEELRVVVDGQVAHVEDLSGNSELVRFEGPLTLTLPSDRQNHFVVIEAGASLQRLAAGESETGVFGTVMGGHLPLAFTNPIFVNGP